MTERTEARIKGERLREGRRGRQKLEVEVVTEPVRKGRENKQSTIRRTKAEEHLLVGTISLHWDELCPIEVE